MPDHNDTESIRKSFNIVFKTLLGTIGTALLVNLSSHTPLWDVFKEQGAETTVKVKSTKSAIKDSLTLPAAKPKLKR